MKIKILIAALSLLLCSVCSAEIPVKRTWTQTFFGGASRFTTLAWDKTIPGKLYAGSDVSGAWVSVDSGVYWSHMDRSNGCADVESIIQSDSNPDVFYMACGYADGYKGVWKSSDHANTWSQLPGTSAWQFAKGSSIDALAIDRTNPDIVYAGLSSTNGGHIYITTDGGANWSKYDNAPFSGRTVWSLYMSADSSHLFASNSNATGANVKVYDLVGATSASYTLTSTLNTQIKGYSPGGTEKVCVTAGRKLACTVDYGVNWTYVDAMASGDNMTRFDMVVDGADGWIFATGINGTNTYSLRHRASKDNGATWATPAMTFVPDYFADPTVGTAKNDQRDVCVINPNNHNQVSFTALWGIFSTFNWGVTYTNTDVHASNQVITSIDITPNGWILASGMDFGTVLSKDNGVTWLSLVGGSADTDAYKGHHWKAIAIGTEAEWNAGNGTILVGMSAWADYLSAIIRSTDNGVTWSKITAPFPTVVLNSYTYTGWISTTTSLTHCPSDDSVVAVGIDGVNGASLGGIFISTDSGASWARTNYAGTAANGLASFARTLAFDPTDATCQKMSLGLAAWGARTTTNRWTTTNGSTTWNKDYQRSVYQPGTTNVFSTGRDISLWRPALWKNDVKIADASDFPGTDVLANKANALYFDPSDANRVFVSIREPAKDGTVYVSDNINLGASATWTDLTGVSSLTGQLPIRTVIDDMIIKTDEGAQGTLYIAATGGVWKLDLSPETVSPPVPPVGNYTRLIGFTLRGFRQE